MLQNGEVMSTPDKCIAITHFDDWLSGCFQCYLLCVNGASVIIYGVKVLVSHVSGSSGNAVFTNSHGDSFILYCCLLF